MKLNELSPAAGSTHKGYRVGRGAGSGNGFKNIFATKYASVNVEVLSRFEDGAVVDTKALQDAGIVKKTYDGVKFLGRGEVTKKLTVKAAAFSEGAKSKIEAAGGKAEVV